ncbi:MAG TPA: hypothetical protein VFS92_10065 [Planctomycetota bacterium]|nr:hypothetical protein [Planctomycetota bacterium]
MAANSFRAIRSGALPGARNMALDEAISAAPAPTLRLYRWDPWTLSLGWFQAVAAADLEPWRALGYGVTRRATGGGAILHGDEVTYALVLPADDPRIPGRTEDSYRWLHGAVREALAAVGVDCDARGPSDPPAGPEPFFCFARTAPFDLTARGRKLVGSAQRRTRAAFLQHGSIPLSPGATAPGATSVSEQRGAPADAAALEDALVAAFARVLGAAPEPAAPTASEEGLARALERDRYGDPAWVLRPWKRSGRAAGPVPPPPGPPGAAAGDPAIVLLRAAVEPDRLLVLAAAGGVRPDLPHARLRAADAALVTRRAAVPLAPERDPWDSTFRRSSFAAAQGAAGPEGLPPVAREVEEESLLLAFRWGDPPAEALLDARRFNFRDLGRARTGDPARDAAALLRALLDRAPGAARGPGARSLLAGLPPPPAASEGVLRARLRAPGG